MEILRVIIVLALAYCNIIAAAQLSNEDTSGFPSSEHLSKNVTWNYLVFTQQWPQTICQIWQDQSKKHQCDIPDTIDTWTVHGIWPSTIDGNDPQFCNQTWEFNITQLQPLLQELKQYWPNIYSGTSEDDFWKHEWTKHGTCAASDFYIDGEYKYFHTGIELLKKYNLNEILAATGIKPSLEDSYMMLDIHAAILSSLGVNATVSCYNHKGTKQHLIKEIRLCLDKDLEAIECPDEFRANLEADQSCPKDGQVFYPPIQPTTFPSLAKSPTRASSEL